MIIAIFIVLCFIIIYHGGRDLIMIFMSKGNN